MRRALIVVMALMLPLLACSDAGTNHVIAFLTLYELLKSVMGALLFGYSITYFTVIFWVRTAILALIAALVADYFLKLFTSSN